MWDADVVFSVGHPNDQQAVESSHAICSIIVSPSWDGVAFFDDAACANSNTSSFCWKTTTIPMKPIFRKTKPNPGESSPSFSAICFRSGCWRSGRIAITLLALALIFAGQSRAGLFKIDFGQLENEREIVDPDGNPTGTFPEV